MKNKPTPRAIALLPVAVFLVLYLVLWLVLGIFLLPTLLNKASKLMSDETLLIVSLGICFGMVLLADALGFSSALGAILAGSLLAGTVHAERVEHLTAGVKDLFGAVFFISVGMMLNPGAVVKYAVPILILTLVTIVGKLIFSSLGVLLSGHTLRQAIHCGCALAQIGEFAFIIASLGLSLGVIADYIYPIIISVSVITTLTTPFFIKSADSICNGIEKLLPEKLVQKLDSYTDAEQAAKEQDSDWAVFLRRYIKRTVFYGVLMLGIVSLGDKLLLPLQIERSMSAVQRIDELNEVLQHLGIHFESFGDNTLLCRSLPVWMKQVYDAAFLRDMSDIWQRDRHINLAALREHAIATMACHSSIRFNRSLTTEEMQQVIEDLNQCEQPFHCPHGRPTIV